MFQQLQALVIRAESLTIFHEKKLADLALKNRLPTMFGFREFADAGGLISYGSSLRETFRRAALYVDRIFNGPILAIFQLSNQPDSNW
jgi:putative tryptophan/tyrosine transport system substrate-binding protein